jgi:hypothetical protein
MLSSCTLCDLEDQKKNCYKKKNIIGDKINFITSIDSIKKKKMKKKKLKCFDRFKLSKIVWLCFVVVFKTLYLVQIRFCNLVAETALIPQLSDNPAAVSRFNKLQASNKKTDHMGISRIVPTWILS